MKIITSTFCFVMMSLTVVAQVPKRIIVEHFTNSLCSICFNRNPGFYENLNNYDSILHLAIYPSAPYPDCLLNQNNVEENDARTNYYGVYGGTPRLVIQGVSIPSGYDYSSSSIFDPYVGKTSPASIGISQFKYADSIVCFISVKNEEDNLLGGLKLFAALAEDTVFYLSPNGEPLHFDVFRKSLFAVDGLPVTLPSEIGDSIIYKSTVLLNPDWDATRLFTIAVLQEADSKLVVQSAAHSVASDLDTAETNLTQFQKNEIRIFPNPAKNLFTISLPDSFQNGIATIRTITGSQIDQFEIGPGETTYQASRLVPGIYFISYDRATAKLIVE